MKNRKCHENVKRGQNEDPQKTYKNYPSLHETYMVCKADTFKHLPKGVFYAKY